VPERYLTHLFVHGDVFHLVFNMLFLYLSGPLIEDVWGRPFFAIFYLLAGLVPAWLFVLQYPHLAIPLIGASGAVAGVLGAMLVRHPQTRIRILWLWGFVARHFAMPAWVVLPAWVGGELAWAWIMDAVAPGTGGGGVAHWVHVYGFVFGVVVAGAVSVLGLERVFAPRARDEGDHAVRRAVERALARERHEEAWTLLQRHVVRTPADHDAALT
jgi:membrane associated rhomboid family serine protease